MKNSKKEEKQTNTNPLTEKRGRGRPQKNVSDINESTQNYQMRDIPDRHTRDQTTQTRNQPRRPGRPRSRSNRRNNVDSSFNNLPPWRGRLRSSANTFRGHSQYCHCNRCQPLHPEQRHPLDDNYPTVTRFLPRHLTIGRREPCFPYNVSTEQFCINHPNCGHYRRQLRRMSFDEQPTPFHSRYNLRPRHFKKKPICKYFPFFSFQQMDKYLLLFLYQLIFTYSALPLYIPVCDCNQAKTRGILDINKPYYCQKGKTDTPHHLRIETNYTLVTKQKPIVTWKGWSCKQWVKSKKITGSFWVGSYDTTYSQETHLVSALESWEMVNNKKCGENVMQESATTMSFIASLTGEGKWYATREYHALNCLMEGITLRQDPVKHQIESPFGLLSVTQQDGQVIYNHNTIVWGNITSKTSSVTTLFHGQVYLEVAHPDIDISTSRLVDTQRQVEISFHNIPDQYNVELSPVFSVVGMRKTFLQFPMNTTNALYKVYKDIIILCNDTQKAESQL
jgi:hypothetical protein